MRLVVQRVSSASVTIDNIVRGAIDRGLLILLGVAAGDTENDARWLAEKAAALRIFPDDAGLMNRSVRDIAGGILVISQFTLIASTRKGTRPSFNDAAKPDLARPLYENFLAQIEIALGRPVARGEFGADMKVALINDGPVTLVLDSRQRD
ncbi:D-tyrosyl-tRNA(Tyr) deacylase [Nibricoccus aquaticus]|uniref:D-aminoacyl-tRNA deacylase n=1 Tax=Nibricoccus aquaticus TaxID=2576891 RepID=A0A290QMF1_9BACT|nr:D-aminoacyl-tRNA deacylase [Nibricoccus aquaticus]ATC65322.1 D-tyrosyl-tRNA(Tyr) deacylase [Nibricoccus aquaticus]